MPLQHRQGVAKVVLVSIVKRNSKYLALFFSAQVRHQLTHRQTPVAQQVHQRHVPGKSCWPYHQATHGRAFGRMLLNLVVHQDRDFHCLDWLNF